MDILFFPLLRILCAHIIADFFLQSGNWITDRKKRAARSPYLYYHILIVILATYLFLADWTNWQLPLFIGLTHFLIDWWKSNHNDTAVNFSIDQAAHLLMILIGWLWLVQPGESLAFIPDIFSNVDFWLVSTVYLIALRPSGFLIGKITTRWQHQLIKEDYKYAGLKDAGTWIGYIERLIIITFILMNQFGAIGFLIAAKSIFRFRGGVKDEQERKHAEYILIGTLISFFVAILLGISALYLLTI